jgi:cytosine/adenosine deaminase-related metal-dependent hydrolase
LHRAHEAGVRFATGTDSGFSVTMYGEWHARELELLMTYAGLSALEAIQAATQHGAKMLNLDGSVGTVESGMLADLIVVDGDPVKDIRVLQDKRRIHEVVKDGRRMVFDEEAIARRWPHERGQIYSVADLTYDLVYDGKDHHDPDGSAVMDADDARDLVADLTHRETSARMC